MSMEDLAQEEEARQWAINNTPRPSFGVHKPGDSGYGPEFCEQCEEPMPAVRRSYGFTLCTACKSLAERVRLRR